MEDLALNTTLKLKTDIARFEKLVLQEKWPNRHDKCKNWDNYKAVHAIMERHPRRDSFILDAGGIESSTLLPSLQKMGYSNLTCTNLDGPLPPRLFQNIVYTRGDITALKYPPNYFDAVGCMSVVEHGVDLKAFFAEMKRVIKIGGTLIISTDYWKDSIQNEQRIMAYGVPIFIFSAKDILDLITIAANNSFKLTSDRLDLDVVDRTVEWHGFQYTFVILGFERV